MRVRPLERKDAYLMLEWMRDDEVVHDMGTDFSKKTIDDCILFIENSIDTDHNFHLAIVDNNDEYMGTVSLKHIDRELRTAEFAITVRKVAMGKGYSQYGMQEILNIGFKKLGLSAVYWCVSKKNTRAVRFYDKSNCVRTRSVPAYILQEYEKFEISELYWYVKEA